MKKLLFIAVVGGLFTFASCSKSSTTGTYTCKCSVVAGGQTTTTSTPETGLTQSEAQTACNGASAQLAASNPGSSCTLQ
jgi:hypothetical protein